jgi:hypothetical protein
MVYPFDCCCGGWVLWYIQSYCCIRTFAVQCWRVFGFYWRHLYCDIQRWGRLGGGKQGRGVSVRTVLGLVLKLSSVVQVLPEGLWCVVGCMGVLYYSETRNYRKLQLQGGGNIRYAVSNTYFCWVTHCSFSGFAYIFIIFYTHLFVTLPLTSWGVGCREPG